MNAKWRVWGVICAGLGACDDGNLVQQDSADPDAVTVSPDAPEQSLMDGPLDSALRDAAPPDTFHAGVLDAETDVRTPDAPPDTSHPSALDAEADVRTPDAGTVVDSGTDSGTWPIVRVVSTPTGAAPNGLAAADFDGDGDIDVAVGDEVTDLLGIECSNYERPFRWSWKV